MTSTSPFEWRNWQAALVSSVCYPSRRESVSLTWSLHHSNSGMWCPVLRGSTSFSLFDSRARRALLSHTFALCCRVASRERDAPFLDKFTRLGFTLGTVGCPVV